MEQTKAANIYTTYLLVVLSIALLKSISADNQVAYLDSSCSKNGHYDQGSEFQNNLQLLLTNLSTEANTKNIYNLTTGNGDSKVYGLFLCNRIFINQACQKCILMAKGEIQRRCPSSVEAIVWYAECMLRYSNHNIFSINDVSVHPSMEGGPAKFSQFNQDVIDTFISIIDPATSENSSLWATTAVYVTNEISLNCYVDCTLDLSPGNCNKCLQTGLGRLQANGDQVGKWRPGRSTRPGMLTPKMFAGLPAYRRKLFRSYCAVACTTVSPSNGSQFGLLGPPELYRSSPSPASDDTKDGDPFMDSMLLRYNTNTPYNMGLTENGSPTYMSSGNPCLDYFFHVVPDTPADEVTRRLRDAWDHDPLTALKLVCNLRGVRGTGKSDREGFYTSALWLHQNHPKTLAANVEPVAEFGYFKDLLEILYRLIEGPTARKSQILWQKGIRTPSEPKSGEEKRLEAAQKGMIKYNTDPAYRFLHEKISDIFVEHLESDMKKLKAGKYNDFSLAAKWCPSLYSTFDNYTSLCESIARRLFPRDKYPEYEGIEEAHYAYRVRDRLRKEVLVPLRRALQLPEVFIGAQEWSSVVYSRVASIAMRNYKDLFAKHDAERFQLYLDSVKKGGAKIAAGALLPHQIVKAVKYEEDEVAELQWTRIVDDLSKIGKLTNCLAISDVSGSMYGEPLEVSVALGLLVSELSEEPWKGKLITFSSQPQLQVIEGKNLRSKIHSVEKMDWEVNTNFQRVFDKILKVAVEGKLKEDEMIKRLFVFSDMEFDEASTSTALMWETDYQAIVRKFNEKGFSRVPEIVFWNLRNSKATPVPSHQPGVALVSGFSKNLLKVFLEQGGVLDPLHTMIAAISGEEYQKLVVLD